jgi:uncharacterized protein YjiS (DUF1127 family)
MSDFTVTRLAAARAAADRNGTDRLFAVLRMMFRTYMTRKDLLNLTSRELADVGLSASTALAEAGRLPWDSDPRPVRGGSGLSGRIQRAWQRARTRRLLSRLEARELRDFAVSPSDAQFEATKPFWRA